MTLSRILGLAYFYLHSTLSNISDRAYSAYQFSTGFIAIYTRDYTVCLYILL